MGEVRQELGSHEHQFESTGRLSLSVLGRLEDSGLDASSSDTTAPDVGRGRNRARG
jgi:hypothetical protein